MVFGRKFRGVSEKGMYPGRRFRVAEGTKSGIFCTETRESEGKKKGKSPCEGKAKNPRRSVESIRRPILRLGKQRCQVLKIVEPICCPVKKRREKREEGKKKGRGGGVLVRTGKKVDNTTGPKKNMALKILFI